MPKAALLSVLTLVVLGGAACSATGPERSGPVQLSSRNNLGAAWSDPTIGPHAVDEARHASDVLNLRPLAPGATRPIPLMSSNSKGMSAPHTAASSPKREVFGFATYWTLGLYAEWDYTALSTIAYFGLDVNADGTFVNSGGGWNGWNSAALTNMINIAHANGVRVVVVIKDFNNSSINTVDANNRQPLINNVIAAIQSKNLDGVNVDFEGQADPLFPDLQVGISTMMADLSTQVRAALPQAEVTIDTYGGAAIDNTGFFNIGAIAPSVDAMFIMGYDAAFVNTPGFAGPMAPMTHFTYNDTADVTQYLARVPASKIILGVPYYGYRWATVGGGPYSQIVGHALAEGYSAAMTDLSCAHAAMTTGWDAWGEGPWASWWSPPTNDPCGDNLGTPAELYYDNATSLGLKYDLVNQNNLRGAGIWVLGYDTGRTELWGALHTYFSCPVTLTLAATQSTTEFSLGMSAGTCTVNSYEIQQYDLTTNQGWFGLASVNGGTTPTALVQGYPGHNYEFQVRAHATSGLVSSWAFASSTVAANASYSHPYQGLYTLDAFGGLSPDSSPPLLATAYWPGWRIARAAKALPGTTSPQNGFVLDGFGGLHPFGSPAPIETSGAAAHYWGFNIARDFAFLPDGSGGFVLDGYGGLHPFRLNGSTAPLAAQGNPYWAGWDVARKVVIFPDATGGYVMDAYGGVHPFGINGPIPTSVAAVASTSYWPGWAIARDMVLIPGNGNYSGYVLDGYGGLHAFHPTGDGSAVPPAVVTSYFGFDITRGAYFLPGSATAGYTLDGFGGLHPFGGAPTVTTHPYWPGADVGIALSGQ